MSSDEQKTAATPGPAAVKREGGKKGGAAGGQREPQYNDTPEHEEQTKRIKEVERQIKEVQGKLSGLHSKGKEIERKVNITLKDKSKIEERLVMMKTRIDKLKAERSETVAQVKAADEVVEQRRLAEAKAKSGLPKKSSKTTDEDFVNACLADIEKRCKELNAEIEASAGSVSEERRLLKEVQRIRATKSQIPVYLQRAKALQEARSAAKRAARDLEAKDKFIGILETEMEELRAEIAALDGVKAAQQEPVKEALTTEEQQLTDKLNALVGDLRKCKEDLNVNREKWYEARREKARAAQEKVNAKKEADRANRAKEQRERAIAERTERKSVLPHAKELGDLASLLQYLDGLLEQEEKSKHQATTTSAAAPTTAAPVAADTKKAAEDDDWGAFAANNKKSKGKNNQQQQQQQAKKKGGAKFVMNLQSMEQFSKQGFAPPLSMEQVPATRDAVKAKLDALQAKSDAELKGLLELIAKEEAEEAKLQELEKAAEAAKVAAEAAKALEDAPTAAAVTEAAKPAEAAKEPEKKDDKKKPQKAKEEKAADGEAKPAAEKKKGGGKK